MEISSTRWISEWEIEDAQPFMDEFKIDPFDFSFDEFKFEEYSGGSDFYGSAVPPSAVVDRPAKQLKVAEAEGGGIKCKTFGGNYKADSSSSCSHIISFEDSNCKSGKLGSVEAKIEMGYESVNISKSWNNNEKSWKKCSPMNRNALNAREHVIAERKRREKLSQRFIALSALIPDLNKVDKASILGGAIRHVKELQERLKVVEEQTTSRLSESQSTVYVKRTTLQVSSSDDDTSSSEENSFSGRPTPEIEARFSNKDVLIRIHCHKRKGCLSYLLNKIENLTNLTILNTCALPFGQSNLDITIVAQVDVGFCMTGEDVVKNLRQALLDFN